jgi:UDP-glucose:(heptosyl)LPS alpha-1,3-glucosyltransferase
MELSPGRRRKQALSSDSGGQDSTVTVVAHDVGPVGGMERMLSELILRLLEKGRRVVVISRSCDLPPHPALLWVRVPGPARPFAIAYPWFFLFGTLITWGRRRGLLHTTGAIVLNRADLSTVHFCHHAARRQMRLLRTSRAGLPYRVNAWIAAVMSRLGERVCYRPNRTRKLVAVSDGLARELREHFPAMADVTIAIANGVDLTEFRPNPEARARMRQELGFESDDLVAAFVGSEWEGKGLRFLVEALRDAREWRLLVVGRGDEARYRRLAAECAPGRVHFIGETTGIAECYAAADVFALPSLYESFSMSAHEAAASGLPVLITCVSGAEDLLVDGRDGWFIDRDPALIAQRLRQLSSDRALLAQMGAAAREATEPMDWGQAVDAYCRLYKELEGAAGG